MSADKRPASGLNFASVLAPGHEDGAQIVSSADAEPVDLDAEALRDLSEEIARDIAPELGRTALVLYDLDPTHLQVQWYVEPEDADQALDAFPGDSQDLRQILRLCRLNREGRSQIVETSDQGVGSAPSQGQKVFTSTGDGASYECEFGLESGDGGWLLLARSNRIQLAAPADPQAPPGSLAVETPVSDQRLVVEDEIPEGRVEAALAAVAAPLEPVFPNTGPVVEPAAWRGASAAAEGPDRKQAMDPVSPMPLGRSPESTAGGGGAATDSVSRASDGMPPPLLPSDRDLGKRAGGMPGPLYDPRAALSSAALRGREPSGSDLEVRAELIVQGKGRPGARVELFGLPVRIETDGHFHVRRSVDAALVLSLVLGRDAAPTPGDPDVE